MKTVYAPEKSYSWIQWPVSLKGLSPLYKPHLTFKFLGTALLDPPAVKRRIMVDMHHTLPVQEFAWEPQFWTSPISHTNHYVLAFVKYPRALDLWRISFDIIKDEYIPWRPHISVPNEYFLLVEDQHFSPLECELRFEEIELVLGGPNI